MTIAVMSNNLAFTTSVPLSLTTTFTKLSTSSIGKSSVHFRRPRTRNPSRSSSISTCTPHMSAAPAEWTAAPSGSDWRAFRAHLRSCERLSQSPSHFSTTNRTVNYNSSIWAHSLYKPEVGAILLSSSTYKWPDSFAHLRRAAILITSIQQHGVSGILLNRPTRFTVCEHRSVLSRVGPEFSSNRVMLGGDCSTGTLCILHPYDNTTICPGATQIIPGIAHGGFNAARQLVQCNRAQPEEFRFFVAYAKWTRQSFETELQQGAWHIMAASPALMLSDVATTEPEKLWSELHSYLS